MLFPIQSHWMDNQWHKQSSRTNSTFFFLQICVQCPHKTPLQQFNNYCSPSVIPSALPPPWLLVSSWQMCLKPLYAAAGVFGPHCRRVGCSDCLAGVHGLDRDNVVSLFPALLFDFMFSCRNCNASEIFTLLPALFDISHKGTAWQTNKWTVWLHTPSFLRKPGERQKHLGCVGQDLWFLGIHFPKNWHALELLVMH